MTEPSFFSRDISWLYFNQRVLTEATHPLVPLAERLKFLSIFSSNLDEFYRVRMPALMAKQRLLLSPRNNPFNFQPAVSEFSEVRKIVNLQQQQFGQILTEQLIPVLAEQNIVWLYNQRIPEELRNSVSDYFFTKAAAFFQVVYLTPKKVFFPENSKLFFFVSLQLPEEEKLVIVTIPSDHLPRFFSITQTGKQYILFIDDIVKANLSFVFAGFTVTGCYSFKITRDAELNLEDELPENIAKKLEKQITKRDLGLATRLLHQPGIPLRHLQLLCDVCKTPLNNAMEGGAYHNLRDIVALPISNSHFFYSRQQPLMLHQLHAVPSLFNEILKKDIAIHPPYHNYNTVLRFFNEAAIDADVIEIYVTLYRIAEDSRIAHALISAAKNGKKVQVFVELKARFDEANNIRWGKKMKEAGVIVTYSIPDLKVHAKIALIKKRINKKSVCAGMLATGNMNESTAKFYTDHVLFTAHEDILYEMQMLFRFLGNRKKSGREDSIPFHHLLVAQFNLQEQFILLIDREIENAKQGLQAGIMIKINNLEEKILISKLYEASNAGVKVQLIVRSICCLIPGVAGMSENITIKRIVSRYLEHGRLFIFHNNGNTRLFMGSADWMNRNIYTRIEVCFPVYDETIKTEILKIVQLQWQDNVQAVWIDEKLSNVAIDQTDEEPAINSQTAIYEMLKGNSGTELLKKTFA